MDRVAGIRKGYWKGERAKVKMEGDGEEKRSCHIASAKAFLSVPNIGAALSTDSFEIVPLSDIFLILLLISPGPSSSVCTHSHSLPPRPAAESHLSTLGTLA